MSLRQQCLDAIYPYMDGDYGNEKWTSDCLDALLDVLEANAVEIADTRVDLRSWKPEDIIGLGRGREEAHIRRLVAALRDSVGVEVDQ